MKFAKDFIWGVATSSYQIEGAAAEDGKGMSIWDIFTKEPGRIFEGHTGDVACDHYHHMKEDVALMAELGIKAYRFSISWPRILPTGQGATNPQGMKFYSDLVDELIKYGITPYATLFHWDYPNELEMQGGWLNPESSRWFEEYTTVVADLLGDRVKHFITFNEPQVFTWIGYNTCDHAPGITYPRKRLLCMCKNIAMAHGKAVQVLRKKVQDCKVGYAPTCGKAYWPIKETPELIEKAKELNHSVDGNEWLASSAFWNELLLNGHFHKECETLFAEDIPELTNEEKRIIGQPLDFCGMNLYYGTSVGMDVNGNIELGKLPIGHGKTAMGWPITPKAMYWAVKDFWDTYQIPLIITENGMSALDVVSLDGKVHDPGRINYLQRHLAELEHAIKDGTKVLGYFQWSFMDNFEWARGYDDRFGIVYVDYETQKRIPKDSFYWYQDFIKKESLEKSH